MGLTPSYTAFAVSASRIPSLKYFYEIYTFDVPGILMAVARLVSHLGGSIEFLCLDERESQRHAPLIIGVLPLPGAPFGTEEGRKGFEYELESLLGVASMVPISRKAVSQRFEIGGSSD